MLAESAQDSEAVGIEVAPVVDRLVCEPWYGSERVNGVPSTEDGEYVGALGKREEVDFVFGDDDVVAPGGVGGQLRAVSRQVTV